MSCEDKTRIINSMMALSGADGITSPSTRSVVANFERIGRDPRFSPAMARSFLHLLSDESDPELVVSGLAALGESLVYNRRIDFPADETRTLLADADRVRQQKGLEGPVQLHTPYAWGSSLPSNLSLADLPDGFQVVLDAPLPDGAQFLSLPSERRARVRKVSQNILGRYGNAEEALDQTTILLELKFMDEDDRRRAMEAQLAGLPYQSPFDTPEKERFRWSYLRGLPDDELQAAVSQAFLFLEDSIQDTELRHDLISRNALRDPVRLRNTISELDELFPEDEPENRLATYKALVEDIGARFTKHVPGGNSCEPEVARLIAQLADLKPGESISDPYCYTGQLISACLDRMQAKELDATGIPLFRMPDAPETGRVHIFTPDRSGVRINRMLARLSGIDAKIESGFTPTERTRRKLAERVPDYGEYDVVVSRLDFNRLRRQAHFDLQKELLQETGPLPGVNKGRFLEVYDNPAIVAEIVRTLRPGGRAVLLLLPEGNITYTGAFIQQHLSKHGSIKSMFILPAGSAYTDTPQRGIVLVFEKGKPQRSQERLIFGDAPTQYEYRTDLPSSSYGKVRNFWKERLNRQAQVYDLMRQAQTWQGDEQPTSPYTQTGGDYSGVVDERQNKNVRIEPVYGRMNYQRDGQNLGGPTVVVAERLSANSGAPRTTRPVRFEELSEYGWSPHLGQGN